MISWTEVAAVLILVFVSSPFSLSDSKAQITREQARSLLEVALRLQGYKVNSDHFEIMDQEHADLPGYYSFGVYDWDYPELQNVIGWYFVDKEKAEVWEQMRCERYDYPQLLALRAKTLGPAGMSRASKVKRKYRPCLPENPTKIIRIPNVAAGQR